MNNLTKVLLIACSVLFSHQAQSDQLAAGKMHSVYLNDNGVVYKWGSESPLGIGKKLIPTIVDYGTEVVKIDASGYHTAILTKSGDLYVSGYGVSTTPMLLDVVDGVTSMAMNNQSIVLLAAGGRVYDYNFSSKILTDTGIENATEVSADTDRGMALVCGVVKSWGNNEFGQLGLGNYLDVPAELAEPILNLPMIVSMSAGEKHTLLLDVDGHVWAFGDGKNGLLGDGGSSGSNMPILVEGLTDIVKVSGGRNQSVAIDKDGQMFVFGWHNMRYRNFGLNLYDISPIKVNAGIMDAVELVTTGGTQTIVKKDGKLHAVGGNTYGMIGDGTRTERNQFVVLGGIDVTQPQTVRDVDVTKPVEQYVEVTNIVEEVNDVIQEVEIIKYVQADSAKVDVCGMGGMVTTYDELRDIVANYMVCSSKRERKELHNIIEIGDGSKKI